MPAQPFANRFAGARKCFGIAVELKGPVGAELERVEFESELSGVEVFVEMAGALCLDDRVTQGCEPLLHDFGDAIADWTRTAIKLRGGGGEETTTAKDAFLHVRQPDVAKFPESRQAFRRFESGFDDFLNEDRARRFDGGHLQVFFGAEVCEEAALAHGKLSGETADRQAFEAFGRGDMHGRFEDRPARPVTLCFTPF